MYAQSLQEALTLNEIIFLKKQVWWTGCSEIPYLCRGGVYTKNSYLLVITDTRNVWITKADQQQINEEKDKFNQSIKIKFEDILKTLDTPLRLGRSSTQFTKLQFRKNREEDLIFTMEFSVGIYPFKWEFFLTKMDDNEIFNILVDDLLNPMAKTVIALEQRGNAYKQKCIQIENEFIKRLSEKERANYFSSVDKDTEDFWSGFIRVDSPTDKLTNFDFGPAAKYFLSKYNPMHLIQDLENTKNFQNVQNQHEENEDFKRMKLVSDYFSTMEEQPLANAQLRPDSKKRYKRNGSEEEIPVLKQSTLQLNNLGIKVNYEEQNEDPKLKKKQDQQQVPQPQVQQVQQNPAQQQDDKKKKKRLDFL